MTNNNDHKPTAEERKKFAQEQIQFLKSKGVKDQERLSRIFKAAGPGQVQAAWELTETATTAVEKDLLDCIINGAIDEDEPRGKERMEAVLKEAGFAIPHTSNPIAFFRMLDGALEASAAATAVPRMPSST